MRFADIAIATPVHTAFTYAVPQGLKVEAGMRVVVPFHRRRVMGICIGLRDRPPKDFDEGRIREIAEAPDDEPVMAPSIMKLVLWMSSYYCAPIGEACRGALPARLMQTDGPKTTRPFEPTEFEPLPVPPLTLTSEQDAALEEIYRASSVGGPSVFLIEGITGSGKTEVYIRLFEKLVADGKRGLLLVPEIGLTPQLTGRAAARFRDRVAVYHSGLTDAQRHAQWLRMKRGEVDVVIGTRSALFAPLPGLGAIVVDEEHDGSYKQDDGIAYHGRDAAVMRAHIEGIPAILGSATPSLESIENARKGKYRLLRLSERPTGAPLPTVEIVDMRRGGRAEDGAAGSKRAQKAGKKSEGETLRREFCALSPALYDAIGETLARGEQVLLFTGRRGFAGSLQCDGCGEAIKCPNCDIALTPHRRGEGLSLACHYCDYSISVPRECPSCGEGSLQPIGHGTERVEDELADFFPRARVSRFDSDSASSPAKRKKILTDMRRGLVDILVGTQMVTKGHDFPNVTLVGVISADVALHLPDFRAAERTFQLLTQVAGRAGRGDKAGRVIVQTRQPGHASFLAAKEHDIASFAEEEIKHRRELHYPPCARLANVRFSSTSADKVARAADDSAKIARRIAGPDRPGRVTLLGPAPAPFSKLKGRHRWQLLVKASSPSALSSFVTLLRPALAASMPSGVRFSLDIDPVNLL